MKILMKFAGLVLLLSSHFSYALSDINTEQEVTQWYQSYADHWKNAKVDVSKVSHYYASPYYYLSTEGPLVDNTETMKASLQSYADNWQKEGWSGAKLLSLRVDMLNKSSAMIFTVWDIYRQDGSSVINCPQAPFTYLAAKTENGWKLTLEIENACPN
ncbi:hypothetical protein [Dasania marina]|uniref:DUF6841 family protein n=1 Tax=Dasania marina TaxID=471499 RepID=UPI0030DA4BAA|tara:strand:+ start:75475 stop:75948 length:474 start_codon:yes stop_codon:yes gene_type:complete